MRRLHQRSCLLGIVLIALNLRAGITVVGPLLPSVVRAYHLNGAATGLLAALPVFAFASVSPLAPRVSRWPMSMERAILVAMIVLALGTILRSLPSLSALYLGTFILGAGIAIANVLLPALVKQVLPGRQGFVTGLYITAMNLVAALASGFAVPLGHLLPGGWRGAYAFWALPAVVAALVWLPQVRDLATDNDRAPVMRLPWRSASAWPVTAFMGLQSFGAYILLGWLPSVLQHHGITLRAAGWELFGLQLAALAASGGVPLFSSRFRDPRVLACSSAGCCLLAYLGLLLAPGLSLAWALCAGAGAGASLVLALTLMGTSVDVPQQTASLSAMAQTGGYSLAAVGPLAFGALHGASGSWDPPLLMLVASGAFLVIAGYYASKPRPHRLNPAGMTNDGLADG